MNIKSLITNKTDNTIIQLMRYFLVGIPAVFADFLVLIVFTEFFKLNYLISAALGFGTGIAVNYILSTVWVFNNRKLDNRAFEISLYLLTGLLGLVLNEVIIWFFTDITHLYYVFSKTIAFIAVYIINFFIRKNILF
ncbi:MAG: GtrA family protein [Candidatus Gastranaerophilales bacterium]|nr:GtrA family protein [Candidatus Gastranaerophilales bacterium]